ncbi:hypothetical protein CALCODRAFT_345145 [Calocera cornea HHB12733]|uniref:Uncharacterized protein n=1 Tax=Calocera cornea HHB12733 TaxID=1353952 RepID=A0A165EUS5_9BASI|nr:hypothetical protein CALCODRAFT_345145 [Calocera cornea HHB12733]
MALSKSVLCTGAATVEPEPLAGAVESITVCTVLAPTPPVETPSSSLSAASTERAATATSVRAIVGKDIFVYVFRVVGWLWVGKEGGLQFGVATSAEWGATSASLGWWWGGRVIRRTGAWARRVGSYKSVGALAGGNGGRAMRVGRDAFQCTGGRG